MPKYVCYVIILQEIFMKFEMYLNSEPFEMTKSGLKTIELRLNDDKRKKIKINDIIEFTDRENNSRKLLCRVINLYRFKNFEELYAQLPLLKCGYTRSNISEAKPSDMDEYYSQDKISEYGVVGIELEIYSD